jgi:6-phosphogluconate dehydrogenase
MKKKQYEIGMVGLGTMGRNLVLNMADRGHAVVGYDRDSAQVAALRQEAETRPIHGAKTLEAFVGVLRRPRAVMMLVPAGAPVDAVMRDLLPHLEPDDLIIDGGNSHFSDTDRRAQALAKRRIHFLGVGISGGAYGARHGPSIMPGGPRDLYARVQAILESIAAKVGNDPCVTWLGPRSAGHYVKMVHNGIEYGLMRLIAETYDLMKRGLGLTDDELCAVYTRWNRRELSSYLVEITARIFRRLDERTGRRLIDEILDEAKQKGTGMWASQDAMALGVPLPTIDIAVAMRNLSACKSEREAAARTFTRPVPLFTGNRDVFLTQLRDALYVGTILTFAQGMAQLGKASQAYAYNLDLEAVARIWRGGCIIRAQLLELICAAYRAKPDLPNLLLDPALGCAVKAREESLRTVVGTAAGWGIPVPALMASLGYFDAYRSGWMPANLIEAQRDYFGAHNYERIDAKGIFHTQWSAE